MLFDIENDAVALHEGVNEAVLVEGAGVLLTELVIDSVRLPVLLPPVGERLVDGDRLRDTVDETDHEEDALPEGDTDRVLLGLKLPVSDRDML